jgi:glycosyltransferase involved in cell wall biosynthesis
VNGRHRGAALIVCPQVSLVLSTYQRPAHLHRSLLSLSHQKDVDGQFEVVVADDGSTDGTADMVRQFAQTARFPLEFTTHEHRGFWLARSRNDGARVSRAPYLVFSDGDCLFSPNFLAQHLRHRQPAMACSGDRVRMDELSTRRLTPDIIARGAFQTWIPWSERRRLWTRLIKDRLYESIHHHAKPKLTGCNIGLWRSDFERVNGFDECFKGWGCEDDDLAERLRMSGVRIISVVGCAWLYHMWHPTHLTAPPRWRDGCNVDYFLRPNKPARCAAGLVLHETQTLEGESVGLPTSRPDQRRSAAA